MLHKKLRSWIIYFFVPLVKFESAYSFVHRDMSMWMSIIHTQEWEETLPVVSADWLHYEHLWESIKHRRAVHTFYLFQHGRSPFCSHFFLLLSQIPISLLSSSMQVMFTYEGEKKQQRWGKPKEIGAHRPTQSFLPLFAVYPLRFFPLLQKQPGEPIILLGTFFRRLAKAKIEGGEEEGRKRKHSKSMERPTSFFSR